MKKSLKIFAAVFITIILLATTIVLATETTNETVLEGTSDFVETETNEEAGIMPISENYEDDYMSVGNNIAGYDETDIWRMENRTELSNSIKGDLYIMSNSANISSDIIEGNAFIMADNVNISGNIYGSVFIMANHVEISGKLENAYIMANTVNIAETAEVERDIKSGANTFNLKGIIYRNLSVAANNINIDENISGINVFGKLDYNGKLNANESQIAGEITEVELPEIEINKTAVVVSTFTDFVVKIITALVVIALIVYISNYKYENKDIKPVEYVKDIAWGVLYLIMIPVISVVLMITIIGIPLGIVGFILYFLSLYIAIPVTSIEISNLILKENNTKIKNIFVALAIFVGFKIIGYIPSIGELIRFLAVLFGLRTIIKAILNKRPKKEKEDVVEINE